MILSYQLLLFLLLPVFMGISLKQYFNNKERLYLWQRFGLKLPETDKPVCFHCASVGEINAAMPLIRLYHEKHPQQALLVTTNTVTAARICRQRMDFVSHCFLPLDYRLCNRLFLKKIRPQKLIILETEIWPNLFQQCHQHNVPVSIINARLSKKTLNTNSWIRNIYKKTLPYVGNIYCRSAADASAYKTIGADSKQLQVIGNIKFSLTVAHTADNKNLINRAYVLAASTREGEEKRILEIWNQTQHKDLLLVIAPRHPQRKQEIINDITAHCKALAVRSLKQGITGQTDVYLADTIGELTALLQHAEFVIMGGSFVTKGGHNILEPAVFSKAIIYGPSMENFADENALFLENNAAIQVTDNAQAVDQINRLIADITIRQQLGSNAKALIVRNSDMAERYLQKICD
ncbi:MAG: hypothetical protein OEY11_10915 [Gammaproteobacteria bacterium]|nr:hypothetical protein [Gammaproteobacteria bacterium]